MPSTTILSASPRSRSPSSLRAASASATGSSGRAAARWRAFPGNRTRSPSRSASVTSPWICRGVKASVAAGEAMARRTSVSSVSTTAVTGIVRPRAFVRSLISFERTASPSGVTALSERFASTTPAAEKPSSAALVASSARVMPQTFISPKTSLLTASETSSA